MRRVNMNQNENYAVFKHSDPCEIIDMSGLFEAGLGGGQRGTPAPQQSNRGQSDLDGTCDAERPLARCPPRSRNCARPPIARSAPSTAASRSKEAYFAAMQFVICADRDRALDAVAPRQRRATGPATHLCGASRGPDPLVPHQPRRATRLADGTRATARAAGTRSRSWASATRPPGWSCSATGSPRRCQRASASLVCSLPTR